MVSPKNKKLAPASFFLKEDVFHQAAFNRQRSHLFALESANLKKELQSILKSIYSVENLEFLNDIHQLNSQRNLSQAELVEKLKKIEKKYILKNADSLINLQAKELSKLRDPNAEKSLAKYEEAIKQVFGLIKDNIKISAKLDQKDLLAELDIITPANKAALDLAAEFNNIIQVSVKKPGLIGAILPANRNASLFISCQDTCKTAQQELRQLVESPEKDKENFDEKLAAILDETKEKLSVGFTQIKGFEANHPGESRKSEAILMMIKAIDATDMKVNFLEGISKRGISTTVKSESSTEEPSYKRPWRS